MGKHLTENRGEVVELVDLYDENNLPLGRIVARNQAHAEGLWHRTVHIYITRTGSTGKEVLVHVRSKNKKQYPGKLDPVFGGHIKSGECAEDAALSEVEEEIGVVLDKSRLVFHGCIKKDDEVTAPGDKEFNMLFSYEISQEEQGQIKLQEEEVESAEWIPYSDLSRRIQESSEEWRPSAREISDSLEVMRNLDKQ